MPWGPCPTDGRGQRQLHTHIRYSQPGSDDIQGRYYDSLGRVDIALLKQGLPFDDYEFYLCGPTPFMRSLYCAMLSHDISEQRIHYEFFGPASLLKEDARPIGPAKVLTAESDLPEGSQ
jgi:hypothetical protein